jgi:ribosomal protein S18 acetylase RimI-like enzyme
MPENHVVPFRPEDVHEAAEVLSRGMVTNPIHVAIYRGADEPQRKAQEEHFARMLRDNPREVFLIKRANRIVGVMRLYRCEGEKELPVDFENLVRAGEDSLQDVGSRENYWNGIWMKHDPPELHSHLGPIAVLPEFQRQGIGSIMMSTYCRLVDNRSLPAYLETDRPENVRFYQKFGFKLVEEVMILGVRNFFMWREPS